MDAVLYERRYWPASRTANVCKAIKTAHVTQGRNLAEAFDEQQQQREQQERQSAADVFRPPVTQVRKVNLLLEPALRQLRGLGWVGSAKMPP